MKHVCTTIDFCRTWFIRGSSVEIRRSSVPRPFLYGELREEILTGRDVRANHFGMFKSICADRCSYRTWTVLEFTVMQTYIVRKTSAQYAIYPIFICARFFQYFATKISCLCERMECTWMIRVSSVFCKCIVRVSFVLNLLKVFVIFFTEPRVSRKHQNICTSYIRVSSVFSM